MLRARCGDLWDRVMKEIVSVSRRLSGIRNRALAREDTAEWWMRLKDGVVELYCALLEWQPDECFDAGEFLSRIRGVRGQLDLLEDHLQREELQDLYFVGVPMSPRRPGDGDGATAWG